MDAPFPGPSTGGTALEALAAPGPTAAATLAHFSPGGLPSSRHVLSVRCSAPGPLKLLVDGDPRPLCGQALPLGLSAGGFMEVFIRKTVCQHVANRQYW